MVLCGLLAAAIWIQNSGDSFGDTFHIREYDHAPVLSVVFFIFNVFLCKFDNMLFNCSILVLSDNVVFPIKQRPYDP